MRLWSTGQPHRVAERVIGKLTLRPLSSSAERQDYVAYGSANDLAGFGADLVSYAGVLCTDPRGAAPEYPGPTIYAPPHLEYLGAGDVVLLNPSGSVNVLFRRASPFNTILTTERCNSLCLMCSQPPKLADDSYRVGVILRLLELIDRSATELVISGGEPTLLGEDFFAIIAKAKRRLPQTALHVLTNGRRFEDRAFANRLAAIKHHDLMLGIPLYSDLDWHHDYVVQARGAFDETMAGFYNLAKDRVRLELRVVIHKQTYERLPQLAEFVARNLPFVEHVALMGLEMFGFTPRNLDVLWIDPADYQSELEEATLSLAMRGMAVSIYNHQLCTLPRSLWPYARKSISDWKNVYPDACKGCGVRQFCGGFFQSATRRHSAHIAPCPELTARALSFMEELHGQYALSEPRPS